MSLDLSTYKIEKMIQHQDDSYDEIIAYFFNILNDRSIPENQKQTVRTQFDEVMRLKSITMRPPKMVLTKKD